MWLIHTKTLKLGKHHKPVQSVSFQQFSDLEGARKKRGFAKIKRTCELAWNKHHLEYAWVDTCCIDKTSSAELSEAINSMFRWYQAAAVCFFYLDDMIPNSIPATYGPENIDRTRLEGCKWFNQGWTLQGLLAPRDVEFYDVDWNEVGTNDSWFMYPLSEITGIVVTFLEHGSLIWSAPVATRMRWAAERKTTQPEDMAYCLLGIFEINMALLHTNDLTLFAWTAQVGYPSSLLDKYRGIFAIHPCEFAKFRGIERQSGGGTFQGELAVTNKGLCSRR
ncbi:HET-domain-containing protein [Jackrogersella minutella]|nr:HET-domain-containing protein [Jackrogersella minutella]